MKERIATFCCLMLIQSSVVTAGDAVKPPQQSSLSATQRQTNVDPLRRASLSKTTWTLRSETARHDRLDQAPADAPDTRSWMERHPVWTGAMIGFAAGFAITYAATEGNKNAGLFDMSEMRVEAALVFGGVSAGVGALAGWGIGRSHNDGYHTRSRAVAPSNSR